MDLILKNGRVYTMDGKTAQAVAVQGDTIVKVGTNEEVETLADGSTQVMDLGGRAVVPGFIDTHTHLVAYGCSINAVNLEGVGSKEEIVSRCADFIARHNIPEGTWVMGRGWNQNLFSGEKTFPDKNDLDRVSRTHPILIIRTCGHIGIANTAALESVGVSRDTYIEGGQFDLGTDGLPNGVIREASLEWFKKNKTAKQNLSEIKRAIVDGGSDLLRYGVTSIHTEDSYDLGYGGDFIDIYNAYQELIAEGRLPVRIYQKISLPKAGDIADFLTRYPELRTGCGNDFYRIGPMKQWSDGTLGARTAGMLEPYSDDPGNTGLYYYTPEELYQNILTAHNAGMQVCIHAIGDGALEMLLDAYERVLKESPKENHRHRIVHCFVGHPDQYERIAKMGLIINTQPISTSTDIPMMASRVGAEREKSCHAWRTLTDLGVVITGSSDIPVETPNVFKGVYAIVTRRNVDHNPPEPWNADQAVTVEEALRFFTINGAYSAFEDQRKGTITEGKLADMAVLDKDPFAVDPEALQDILVDHTILGGKVVYSR